MITNILFEPWSLGDALIAASFIPHLPDSYGVLCHPRWKNLLHILFGDAILKRIITHELEYTHKQRKSKILALSNESSTQINIEVQSIFSIRGDLRDYLAASRMFPSASIHMSGWYSFCARKMRILDLPAQLRWVSMRNRYRAWAKILGIEFQKYEESILIKRQHLPKNGVISIHIGAQWRSKQYPWVAHLKRDLQVKGFKVRILGGPNDPMPSDLQANEILRATDQTLVDYLLESEWVISNDSGPLHLASLLGCKTLALCRASNIQEWIPPGAHYIASPLMPNGYFPCRQYMSDQVLEGWPSSEEVIKAFEKVMIS